MDDDRRKDERESAKGPEGENPRSEVERVARARNEAAKKAKEQQAESDARLHRRASWATIVSMVVAIAGLVFVYLAFIKDDGSTPVANSRVPRLERVDLIARNGLPPHHPALELLVHNGGRGRSVISRARIEIMRSYPLPLCFTQGELPVSAHYGLQLPADAEPGEVFEAPIHQQVGADRADRFTIGLGVAPADPGSDQLDGLYLFEVEVSLVHDGEGPALPMGKALVSLDDLPFTTEYLLREGQFPEVVQEYKGNLGYVPPRKTWATQVPCWRRNAQTIIRAGKSGATRSPQLQEILNTVAAPSFSEAEP